MQNIIMHILISWFFLKRDFIFYLLLFLFLSFLTIIGCFTAHIPLYAAVCWIVGLCVCVWLIIVICLVGEEFTIFIIRFTMAVYRIIFIRSTIMYRWCSFHGNLSKYSMDGWSNKDSIQNASHSNVYIYILIECAHMFPFPFQLCSNFIGVYGIGGVSLVLYSSFLFIILICCGVDYFMSLFMSLVPFNAWLWIHIYIEWQSFMYVFGSMRENQCLLYVITSTNIVFLTFEFLFSVIQQCGIKLKHIFQPSSNIYRLQLAFWLIWNLCYHSKSCRCFSFFKSSMSQLIDWTSLFLALLSSANDNGKTSSKSTILILDDNKFSQQQPKSYS